MCYLIVVFAGILLAAGCADIEATRSQPNILIVVLDACRADHVGCYGYDRNTTPNIDAFARDAVLHRNAYANCSWTKPSVTSLLTGLTVPEHGVQAGFDALSAQAPYLPAAMQERGYHAAVFSANHWICEGDGYARGCDTWWHYYGLGTPLPVTQRGGEVDDGVAINRVLSWMGGQSAPWFAYVHLMGPHGPYDKPARVYDFGERWIDDYDEKLRYCDAHVGRLLAAVPPDTIVIITADHGEEFGEHGGIGHGQTLHDEVVHVPLIIRWPGHAPRIETGLVGLDRIAPALLDVRLPETGGEVECHLERRKLTGEMIEHLHRVVTVADIVTDAPPTVDVDALRREQLEALGYF
jgi:arylsulfatase A-like enzyme